MEGRSVYEGEGRSEGEGKEGKRRYGQKGWVEMEISIGLEMIESSGGRSSLYSYQITTFIVFYDEGVCFKVPHTTLFFQFNFKLYDFINRKNF